MGARGGGWRRTRQVYRRPNSPRVEQAVWSSGALRRPPAAVSKGSCSRSEPRIELSTPGAPPWVTNADSARPPSQADGRVAARVASRVSRPPNLACGSVPQIDSPGLDTLAALATRPPRWVRWSSGALRKPPAAVSKGSCSRSERRIETSQDDLWFRTISGLRGLETAVAGLLDQRMGSTGGRYSPAVIFVLACGVVAMAVF